VSLAERQQTCPRCGAVLDVTAVTVGAWLACPGCAQPVQVLARRLARPPRPAEPEPPSAAWLSDPRLDAPAVVPAPAPRVTETTPPLPPWSPAGAPVPKWAPTTAPVLDLYPEPAPAPSPARRRRLGGVVFMLSVMGATAQVIFVSSVLQAVSRPEDVALSALFGAAFGAFVAMMSVSIRREDEARARGGG
jgi:hypothetical protein